MLDLLEAIMIFCWGLSWPICLYKTWTSRTAKGKSMVFEIFTLVGYIAGITRKFIQIHDGVAGNWLFYLSLVFYFINFSFVFLDWILWFRNHRLDMLKEEKALN